uniref:Peptidase_M13_N domain-containing protein n=2 Tax=Bursaphelenchus xylophilus TaxID=6326 RepID=A0A1I7S2U9_BURXY
MDKKWAEVLENLPSFGAYGKAKLIYDKCMDDQLSPYSTYDTGFPSRYFKFKQVVGVAFPLLTNSSESLYKPLPERMAEILLFLMPEDINIFTEATVRTTHYNTSDYSFVLEFAEPYLLLDDYYHRREDGEKRNETKTELVKIIARAAELLNITIDTSVVEDGVESVLEFEKRLV